MSNSESNQDPSEPSSSDDERAESRVLSNERAWTAIIVGVVLLTAVFALGRSGPSPSKSKSEPQRAKAAPLLSPEAVPLVTGEEPVQDLFVKAGCVVCHTIPGIAGATGRVGPELLLRITGPDRLADPKYRGKAKTVREYIVESILSPSVYVVPGYPDRTMPNWYGQKLSAGAVEKIVTYLEHIPAPDRSSDG
ncbi:MAG TPA: c-type cytochrome [Nitrospiraceae bacterium]|jgi:mono/diheme cytochrome c family protein|nr:c-type cytochrome [Nitrospiraceae bacterium]